MSYEQHPGLRWGQSLYPRGRGRLSQFSAQRAHKMRELAASMNAEAVAEPDAALKLKSRFGFAPVALQEPKVEVTEAGAGAATMHVSIGFDGSSELLEYWPESASPSLPPNGDYGAGIIGRAFTGSQSEQIVGERDTWISHVRAWVDAANREATKFNDDLRVAITDALRDRTEALARFAKLRDELLG